MTDERSATRSRAQWERLAELVTQASRLHGLRTLTEAELLEFGRLYRRAAAELSHARAYGLDAAQLEYLNWLVGRAYGLLYVSESSGWAGIVRFFRAELPQTLRRQGRIIALSAGIFLGAQVPPEWGLDFTLALTFIAIAVPAISNRPSLASALSAGVTALLTWNLPYKLGLIASALVGIGVGLWSEKQ
jgi:hypothetical protein